MHTDPNTKSKMNRALSKSINIALKELIQIFLSENDRRIFLICLRSLYESKNLPSKYEYSTGLKIIGGYLRSTQNLRLQKLEGAPTDYELERSYNLLLKASKWVHNLWSPIVKKNVLIHMGSKDAVWYLMQDYFDLSDKTRGGLYIGRLLRYLLED